MKFKTQLKLLIVTLIVLAGICLYLNSVMAFDFDNVKTYDASKREVTIVNAFGLGADLAKIKLTSEPGLMVIRGRDRKVAEIEINSYTEYKNFLSEMEFYDLKNHNSKIERQFTFKKKIITSEEYDDYKFNCDKKTLANGSIIDINCKEEIIKKYRDKENWIKMDSYDIKDGDSLTIGIFTDVYANEIVEWIPTFLGNSRVNEWTNWTEGLNTQLDSYYNFTETTGDTILHDSLNKNNGTIYYSKFSMGKFNNAIVLNGSSSAGSGTYVQLSSINYPDFCLRCNKTISFWYNSTYAPGEYMILMANAGNNGVWMRFTDHKVGLFDAIAGDFEVLSASLPATANNGTYHHIVIVRGGKSYNAVYFDGVSLALSNNNSMTNSLNNGAFKIGQRGDGYYFNGNLDELAIWNRTLSAVEVAQLYSGVTYNEILAEYFIDLKINTPVNYFNSSVNLLTINCSATNDIGITNLSLLIDGAYNYSIVNTTAYQNLSFQITQGYAVGQHTLNCSARNSPGYINTSQIIFNIDTDNPAIIINFPKNTSSVNTLLMPVNVTFNFSLIESVPSRCIFYNGTNSTVICGKNLTTAFSSEGFKVFGYYVNDSQNRYGANETRFLLNYVKINMTYTTPAIEGDYNLVCINITATNVTSFSANMTINNTIYYMSGSITGTNAYYCNLTTNPLVNSGQTVYINVSYTLNDVPDITGSYALRINDIPLLIINDTCSPKAIIFDLKDEENLTSLSTGIFEYNFYYGSNNATSIRTYGTISGFNFSICINDTISNNWTLGSGEIFYHAPNYVDRRYYLFSGTKLTNITQNITLYDLLSASQTSFKLEVETTSLSPYINKYAALYRWYPDLNEYRIVDMGFTDENGETVIHVVVEDVDYRIGIYETNGQLIKLASPIRMVCLSSPCTYTLKVTPNEEDYTSFLGIEYSFNYNYTTAIWSFTFNDPSLKSNIMNLTVLRQTSTTDSAICSTTIAGASGTLSCNTSGYTGTLKGIVTRQASPAVIIAEKIITITSSAFRGTFGLWISLLLAIPIIFIFALMSPIIALFGGVIALIPAFYFKSINWAIIGGFAVLAAIVAHFLKRIG